MNRNSNSFFNANFTPSGDNNRNSGGNNGPSRMWAIMFFILIAAFASGASLRVLIPLVWLAFMIYILYTASKKGNRNNENRPSGQNSREKTSSYESDNNQPSKAERDYQLRKTKHDVEVPGSMRSYERADMPSASNDKRMQAQRDSHTHNGSSAFDSYTGNYATGTVKKCKCPKCGYVTDTAHRYCGKCDADLSK